MHKSQNTQRLFTKFQCINTSTGLAGRDPLASLLVKDSFLGVLTSFFGCSIRVRSIRSSGTHSSNLLLSSFFYKTEETKVRPFKKINRSWWSIKKYENVSQSGLCTHNNKCTYLNLIHCANIFRDLVKFFQR